MKLVKLITISALFICGSNAFASLGLSDSLDPISLVCSNDKKGTDKDLSVEVKENSLIFSPHEEKFEITSYSTAFVGGAYPSDGSPAKSSLVFKFQKARTTINQEGVKFKATISGYVSVSMRGREAYVSYSVNSGKNKTYNDLECNYKQRVRVVAPNSGTKENCTNNGEVCLYDVAGSYYELWDASAVKAYEKLSKAGCASEGIVCLVKDNSYFGLEIPDTKVVIWE